MNEDDFAKIVQEEWANVPERFRGRIDNVALLIEDEPSEETRTKEGLTKHETLLGLYHGIPQSARGGGYGTGGTLPDTITLYRLPLLEEAERFERREPHTPFAEHVRRAVHETLWHEVGHYFGLGEEAIDEREAEGTNEYQPE